MQLSRFIAYVQDRLAKRRAYRRLVAEIDRLTERDLKELNAFQSDLYRAARDQVFGR